MSGAQIAQILARFDDVIESLADLRGDVRVLQSDVAEIKGDVVEVKAETKSTNGRLRRVELWKHGMEQLAKAKDRAVRAHAWVPPAVAGAVTGSGLVLLSAWVERTF